MTSGRIFNIQRYSLHDGKGIRTIVFFQGCFMRCRWCCNPESQSKEGKQGGQISVSDVMAVVERDMPYYRRSGGGLTLSGGEVLVQPDFAKELLRSAKELGIHTAIESTALAEYSEIEKLLPYLDEFLLDIKHMDPLKHESFTGRRNDIILENAKKIAAGSAIDTIRLVVRVPVIPGFNDTMQEISEIARFAKSICAEELHLLPYHRLGEGKYAELGREYPMKDVQPLGADLTELLKSAVTSAGLCCKIGGD